jgi:gas vesicle protein
MHNTKSCYSGLSVSFVVGALAGILLTTRSGQEVRWDLEDYAREKQQHLLRKAKKTRAELGDAIQRGKTSSQSNGQGRRTTQMMKNRMLVRGVRPEGNYAANCLRGARRGLSLSRTGEYVVIMGRSFGSPTLLADGPSATFTVASPNFDDHVQHNLDA